MNIDPDHELESNPEYRRILAELSPDERLRVLGTEFSLAHELDKKEDYRRRMAALPTAEKLRILDELRRRAQMQKGSRRSMDHRPPPSPLPLDSVRQSPKPKASDRHRAVRSSRSKDAPLRFGGRANAGGVSYEGRVAAFIAVKMLAGSRCVVWSGISGSDLSAITMQAPEPVDDIVVNLRGTPEACVFISAKRRSGTIPLTAKSPAFADTVDAFVRQFLKLPLAARVKGRFIWAIPSTVGLAATHDLVEALDALRMDGGGTSLSKFIARRSSSQAKALLALREAARRVWRRQTAKSPRDEELRGFLRQVYAETYDFESGHHHERQAEGEIRNHIVADPDQAPRVWEKLEHFFAQVNQRGVQVTSASLRQALVRDGIELRSPPDYAEDIAWLKELTVRNLERLEDHTRLPFGPKPTDAVHITRTEELSALIAAAKSGHLLLTGEPGCGKSGLIRAFVGALQKDGSSVVLLLAEEVFCREPESSAHLLGLVHVLDDVLSHWPNETPGFLVTDALDAVRDPETQKRLRRLLRDVQEGKSGWRVIASVREFDLKFGRELREAFPGAGVSGHASSDFADVAHFHLTRLSETELDQLAARRAEILPFITAARKNAKAAGIHRSPFYLRLAADLLRDGGPALRLADWASPALLMRKFWDARVKGSPGEGQRESTLETICLRMTEARTMAVSLKELSLGAPGRESITELRSRGILQEPVVRHGTPVGGDEIRFTHHLLHDYAIARSLIPETRDPFCDFTVRHPLLPIFYRQSFLFALEELWDMPVGREGFWESAFRLEGVTSLHGLTRILAPVLAARRVEALSDLQPLLTALASASDANAPAHKALLHLASGLQDVHESAIRAGAAGWCAFVEQLAGLLPAKPFLEWPLVHILARLNAVNAPNDAARILAVNVAGRRLLAHHVGQAISPQRQYPAHVSIETICRTFPTAPAESEQALLSLLAPERLAQFPHHDLHDLALNLKYLGSGGDAVVLKLFEAAFAKEPPPGQRETTGSLIMSMSFETRDEWHMVHHALANYYETCKGDNAALMTDAACIAWNAVLSRRSGEREPQERILATVQFRGVPCILFEDYSHIWGRSFEPEESRVLSHFEELLRGWAAHGDTARLNAALDHFAVRNRTSLMWTVFLEAAAAYPSTLGALMEGVLNESLFLTHADYAYGGTALLSVLHKAGDAVKRERLERLILDLPKNVRLRNEADRNPTPSWVEHAQNRLLGALEEPNIVLGAVRDLRRQRQTTEPLPENARPEGPSVISHTYSDEELIERRGVSLKEPANQEMFRLCEALRVFLPESGKSFDDKEAERQWDLIERSERAVRQYKQQKPELAEDLWGHLVGACEKIASHFSWASTDARWQTVRRILLEAATDRVPEEGDDEDMRQDRWPTWGWPAPRVDAAQGLPLVVLRLGKADDGVATALRKLCRDKSHPVRFNLADRLAVLEEPASDLMWDLIDAFIAEEKRFSVLDVLLLSVNRLWPLTPDKVTPRVRRIAERAKQNAPADAHIHGTLAHTYLFHFLRTGDPKSEEFITMLIAECDSPWAAGALVPQLHSCRAGGWLTVENGVEPDARADAVRARTWGFFTKLLTAAQTKLQQHREACGQLHKDGRPNAETVEAVKEKQDRAFRLVDAIAMQLYFASGAYGDKTDKDEKNLALARLHRFWQEAAPLLDALAAEPHPHTAHQLIQTLHHLLPCSPSKVFLLAAKSIRNSVTQARFQYESLAVGDVVKLLQRALADHREIFRSDAGQESECLTSLLEVLDMFVEAGWAEARQLTHRLEEIYR